MKTEQDHSGMKCDLHPKWSYDGNYICVDTNQEKKRDMFLYDVRKVIK